MAVTLPARGCYGANKDNVYCFSHNASFTTAGYPAGAPAKRSLTQYKATISSDGKSLLITN